ncbi:MAG: hypothetical protein ISS83_01730 [Candidatus Pacebacteria bacterium]|nr:hypothetical protein [Candidatus Paceibacterota bacterium]
MKTPEGEPNIYGAGPKNENLTNEKERRQEKIEKDMGSFLKNNYEKNENNNQRVEEIIEAVKKIFESVDKEVFPEERLHEIINQLNRYKKEDYSQEEFLSEAESLLKPVVRLYANNLEKAEEKLVKEFNEQDGFIEINRVVSYGKTGSMIHLHHLPARAISTSERLKLYEVAMKKLATIVNNDPNIEEITATSWIVAKNPELFEGAGFEIEDVKKELKEKHFQDEKRDIKHATMTRKDFLEKYLTK